MSEPDAGVSLRLEELSVARGGRPVVSDVSLEIPPAQVTTLLGANGAGKSTLVLAVAGILRPSGGRVLLGDRDLTRLRPEQVRAAGVAVVPEGRRLLPALTVEDNLRVATYSLSQRGREERASPTRSSSSPSSRSAGARTARLLSGGEQQMVVLAQALVSRPEGRPRRRALARSRAGRRQAPRADARGCRRERRRRPPDRAVRARGARPRADRLRDRGRRDPLRTGPPRS